jgi:hypothetical protein
LTIVKTKKCIHLYQNPPALSSTMKTIFPNKSRCYGQINLKIMIDYVEMDIKACIQWWNQRKNWNQVWKGFFIVNLPSRQFWLLDSQLLITEVRENTLGIAWPTKMNMDRKTIINIFFIIWTHHQRKLFNTSY